MNMLFHDSALSDNLRPIISAMKLEISKRPSRVLIIRFQLCGKDKWNLSGLPTLPQLRRTDQ